MRGGACNNTARRPVLRTMDDRAHERAVIGRMHRRIEPSSVCDTASRTPSPKAWRSISFCVRTASCPLVDDSRAFRRDPASPVQVSPNVMESRRGALEVRDARTARVDCIEDAGLKNLLQGLHAETRDRDAIRCPDRRVAGDPLSAARPGRSTRRRGAPAPLGCTLSLRPVAGGRGGIRTLEGLRLAGFQDRCIRPLCHPSHFPVLPPTHVALRET
jgi:hypothetical protein